MISAALKGLVRSRAKDRCEYCRLPQSAIPDATFHVEHFRARQHNGTDDADNLALACDRCNLFKGPNLTAVDPDSQSIATLFNPRTQKWSEHFHQIGFEIEGITDTGRATVALLNMNARRRVQLRTALIINLREDE